MRRYILLLLLPVLLLCGCAGAEDDAQTVSVYRVLAVGHRRDGELLRSESVTYSGSPIGAVIDALQESPADSELDRSLPENVRILSWSIDGGELTLELSPEYLELQGMDRTLADCCAALSLCALNGVESVSTSVDSRIISSGLSTDSALLSDVESNPYEKRVKLYFLSNDGRYLSLEYHTLAVGEAVAVERVVMEELLRGPYDDKLTSAVPSGTGLRSVVTENGLCTVDLSSEFLSGRPDSAADGRLAVYAVVNSLTSLSHVDSVRILVDGVSPGSYLNIPLSAALGRCEAVIGPANVSHGEKDVSIFVAPESGGEPVELPVIVRDAGLYPSQEQLVLSALMEFEDEPGYLDLFPDDAVWLSVSGSNGLCVVDLPSSFFESHGTEELAQALDCITSTLTALDNVNEVVIFRDGRSVH